MRKLLANVLRVFISFIFSMALILYFSTMVTDTYGAEGVAMINAISYLVVGVALTIILTKLFTSNIRFSFEDKRVKKSK